MYAATYYTYLYITCTMYTVQCTIYIKKQLVWRDITVDKLQEKL